MVNAAVVMSQMKKAAAEAAAFHDQREKEP
jgi:hypothetical protein